MKIKIFILSFLFFTEFIANCQTSVITFAPMGIVNKFRMKYELSLNNNVSSGVYLNVYYAYFKGVRVDPIIRLYPTGKAPKGFYLQAKAVVGYFNSDLEYKYEIDSVHTDSVFMSKNFSTFGGGLGIGYQFLIGSKKFPIDIFLGFQYSKFTAPQTIKKNGKTYSTSDDLLWYFTGPGSFLNGNVGIGFTF